MYVYVYHQNDTVSEINIYYMYSFSPIFGTNSLCDRKYIMHGGDGLAG